MRTAPQYVGGFDMANASADYVNGSGTEKVIIKNDFMMEGLTIEARFRAIVSTGAAVPAFGSPFTFLERMVVEGDLIGKGHRVLFDMSGRQLSQFVRAYRSIPLPVEPDDYIVDVGAVATYDMAIYYYIPLNCLGGSPMLRRKTLLPGNRFTQELALTLRRGSLQCLGENASGTTAFTAFSSATGSPRIEVMRHILKEGPGKAQPASLLAIHRRIGPFSLDTTQVNTLIGELPIGDFAYTCLHLQQGTLSTGGSTPELITASNALLTRPYLRLGDNVIRDTGPFRLENKMSPWRRGVRDGSDLYLTAQAPQAQINGYTWGQRVGELLIDFYPDGQGGDALKMVGRVVTGERLYIYGDVTGAANQQLEVLAETIEPL